MLLITLFIIKLLAQINFYDNMSTEYSKIYKKSLQNYETEPSVIKYNNDPQGNRC